MMQSLNIIDYILIILISLLLIRSIIRGFIREITTIIGLIIAFITSLFFYSSLANLLRQLTDHSEYWWDSISFIAILVLVFSFCLWSGSNLARLVNTTSFFWLDHLLGIGTGLIKGVLFSYLLVNLLLIAIPLTMLGNQKKQHTNLINRSYLAPYIIHSGHYLINLLPKKLNQKIKNKKYN